MGLPTLSVCYNKKVISALITNFQNRILPKLLRSCFLTLRFVLIVRYFRKRIPKHQLFTFIVLKKFLKICKDNNIRCFAFDGTLLGAVRDGKFAGRPSDLDFIVFEEDLNVLKTLGKVKPPRRWRLITKRWQKKGGKLYFQVNFFGENLTLELIYSSIVIHSDQLSLKLKSSNHIVDFYYFDLDDFVNFETAYIYGLEVMVPRNPEKYAELLFGRHWRIPKVAKQDFVIR